MKILGIDIGGSFIKFGVIEEDNIIHNHEIVNTAQSKSEFLQIIAPILIDLKSKNHFQAIGIGFPGTVLQSGEVQSASNMQFWVSENILEIFSKQFNCPIFIQNDAYLAGFAEAKSNNELDEYYFVTLGTGIGSVLIRNKELVTSQNGSSGELGHIIINYNEDGNDYRTGIFEQYFNSKTFVDKAKSDLKNFPNSLLNSIDNFTVREISEAVNIGDDLAITNFMEMGKILGIGLSSVANLTGIPIFVIGGGISKVNNLLFDTAIKTMRERVIPELKELISIKKSNLYNQAGFYGAALYARENIK